MAKFRQYNLQLLPLDTKSTEEVGVMGYKELFDSFAAQSTNAYKNKSMASEAKTLINDTFICPFVIHTEEKFAYGSFVKFHKAETVTEFYTQKRLFEAPQGTTAVSNTYYFRFVFDFENHRFAIDENGNRLPSPQVMLETLQHFLNQLATRHFPMHVLTANLVSDNESLKAVLDSDNEFGPIHVKIAFPNSRKLNSTLSELKDLNAHSIEANVSPSRSGRMTGIPTYIQELLQNAAELGDATVTFFKKSLSENSILKYTRKVYSTQQHPRWLTLRQKAKETDYQFMKRTWLNLKALAERDAG